jgi:hypothetical protein
MQKSKIARAPLRHPEKTGREQCAFVSETDLHGASLPIAMHNGCQNRRLRQYLRGECAMTVSG